MPCFDLVRFDSISTILCLPNSSTSFQFICSVFDKLDLLQFTCADLDNLLLVSIHLRLSDERLLGSTQFHFIDSFALGSTNLTCFGQTLDSIHFVLVLSRLDLLWINHRLFRLLSTRLRLT